jgi:hypothetical protein
MHAGEWSGSAAAAFADNHGSLRSIVSLRLQFREPPVECGYLLSAKMLRIKHADCFAILPLALDAAAAFQDFVHIRGGLLEIRQHSAARPRSGYFGVTLILNHLIGPSERRGDLYDRMNKLRHAGANPTPTEAALHGHGLWRNTTSPI